MRFGNLNYKNNKKQENLYLKKSQKSVIINITNKS